MQQLGSPARSTAMGLGYPGMGQAGLANSHQPSGDLLAMINKTGGASQLSNFGSLNQSFGGQQQQGVQGNAVAGQAQGQVYICSRVVVQWRSHVGMERRLFLDMCWTESRTHGCHRNTGISKSLTAPPTSSRGVSGRSAADGPMLGLGSMNLIGVPCLQEKEQPAFDASEFPALGGGLRGNVGLANGDSSGTLEGSNNLYANLGMQKGMLPSEFNIQSEEFPALPGANASSRTGGEDSQQSDQQQQQAQSNQVRN